MRKRLCAAVLVISFLLSGCQEDDISGEENLAAYQEYYEAVESNSSFSETSSNYTVSAELTEVSDGSYRYYIIIDEPTTAMYHCAVMAVENDISYTEADHMMPSIGVLDDSDYSMVPNQVNTDDGFVKGMTLSGESSDDTISIKMLVEWKNAASTKTTREFIGFVLNEEGMNPLGESD